MVREIRLKLLSSLLFILLLAPVFTVGFLLGNYTGNLAVKRMIRGGKGVFFLLFRPAGEFFRIYRMLNSNSDVIRLSGYYSMLDNNIIDEEFLEERFVNERNPAIKRTIIWLTGFSEDFERIKAFYNKVYDESTVQVKREILRIYKKKDPAYYNEFIKLKKAGGILIGD